LTLLNKILIRKDLFAKRQAITESQKKSDAEQAAKIMQSQAIFQQSREIACYLARDDEFDTQPLIELIWKNNKNCYLPVLPQAREKFLDFGLYRAETVLRSNRYKILEPEGSQQIHGNELDLVFIPLVGFDLKGNRLGMGGGYYDRSFEFLLKNSAKKPLLIGLAYAVQQVKELPQDPWDVPLDGMLTEKEFKFFAA
jgi:5-formyltetrahydrofolate cyclo-ligase